MKKITLFLVLNFFTWSLWAQSNLQYDNPVGQEGLNTFEPGKEDTTVYRGLKTRVGGSFALQFQALEHENNPVPDYDPLTGELINDLPDLGPGFNTATANLNLDVQLGDGIRLNLITYLSSRNHSEAWVKGGYLRIDEMKFLNSSAIDNIMDHVAIKVGHMEINHGDAHFRRTDNGNAFQNPFIGNYIMDAFTTEVGGEVYVFFSNFFVMAAATNGEIKGRVKNMEGVKPSYYGKIGYDNQLSDDFRLRLTGSIYNTESSGGNTLYGGDRAGARYYDVMDGGFTSGRWNPGFRDQITSIIFNPFLKFKGFELFGNIEQATGTLNDKETDARTWTQLGGDIIYRFGRNEDFYLGARYNTVSGPQPFQTNDVTIDRIAGVAGVFITNNILAKVEYVRQDYNGYEEKSIYHGGQFSGLMVEGAITF